MTVTLNERLSAFLDGELPAQEVELLLKQIEREPQLRVTLSRYATVGECLRNEHGNLSPNFVDRVSEGITSEHRDAAAAVPGKAMRGVWLRKAGQLVGGFALAATVAGAGILLLQREQQPTDVQVAQSGAEAQHDVELIAAESSAAPGAETVVGNARDGEMYSYTVPAPVKTNSMLPEARLTDYVFAHSEYSSPLGRSNVLSSMMAEDPMPVDTAEPHRPTQSPNNGNAGDASRRDGSPAIGDLL